MQKALVFPSWPGGMWWHALGAGGMSWHGGMVRAWAFRGKLDVGFVAFALSGLVLGGAKATSKATAKLAGFITNLLTIQYVFTTKARRHQGNADSIAETRNGGNAEGVALRGD
jgi:hypothetical protein